MPLCLTGIHDPRVEMVVEGDRGSVYLFCNMIRSKSVRRYRMATPIQKDAHRLAYVVCIMVR